MQTQGPEGTQLLLLPTETAHEAMTAAHNSMAEAEAAAVEANTHTHVHTHC